MHEGREEHGVVNEKYGTVVTDQVPYSVFPVEFYSKATMISVRRKYVFK
jgi:hypothetical protein